MFGNLMAIYHIMLQFIAIGYAKYSVGRYNTVSFLLNLEDTP